MQPKSPLLTTLFTTATLAITFFAALSAPATAVINHISPSIAALDKTNTPHIEQSLTGLNSVLKNDFSDLPAFPYWDRVGFVGMGSGVYLGKGVVLTSAHVGCYPFRHQDGTTYQPDYKTWQVLKNKDGSKSDLATYSITVDPSSPLAKAAPIALGTSQANRDNPVVLVGSGYTQGGQPLSLSAAGKPLTLLGYSVQPRRVKAWGINRGSQEIEGYVSTARQYSTQCFTTRFDQTAFAGQPADGDSGGGAFAYNREFGRWELVGCIIAVSHKATSVTFGSRTFLGEIGSYAMQIPGMEPLPAGAPAQRLLMADASKIGIRPLSVRMRVGATLR